jgi:NO-binding membrane sensor protein with MHYT domain
MVVNFESISALSATTAMPGMGTTSVSSFDPTLVTLSFVISVFGCLTGLQSARRARDRVGTASFVWLAAAAVSIGGGAIWSMHFIGMLAYHNDVSYSFNITRTLLSLVVAIVASGVGLFIASQPEPSIPRYILGGTFAGLGVAGMHYLGMAAMQMNADLTYRAGEVGLSLVIAVVAASVALYFAFTVRRAGATVVAAVVMGAGICGLHYTGMFAAVITPRTDLSSSAVGGVSPLSLGLPVFGLASVLLFVLLFVGLFQDADGVDAALRPATSSV